MCSSAVEDLYKTHEALGLIPSTTRMKSLWLIICQPHFPLFFGITEHSLRSACSDGHCISQTPLQLGAVPGHALPIWFPCSSSKEHHLPPLHPHHTAWRPRQKTPRPQMSSGAEMPSNYVTQHLTVSKWCWVWQGKDRSEHLFHNQAAVSVYGLFINFFAWRYPVTLPGQNLFCPPALSYCQRLNIFNPKFWNRKHSKTWKFWALMWHHSGAVQSWNFISCIKLRILSELGTAVG